VKPDTIGFSVHINRKHMIGEAWQFLEPDLPRWLATPFTQTFTLHVETPCIQGVKNQD